MEGTVEAALKTAATSPQKESLTGLYRQDYLFVELAGLLQKQRFAPVEATLALLQLENFYEIRRWVGKSEANLLLSDISSLLARSLPRSVLLCRCAHYEFAALFRDDCSVHAQLLIQRVKQALQHTVSDSIPPQLELKCSIGLAPLAPTIPSAEVLFARARHNLSLALSRQRQSDAIDTLQGAKFIVPPAQLSHMLQSNQLALNFQALVSLKPDGLRHYEVRCQLAHHDSPDEPSLPPDALFESANQNAMGEQLDRWVIARCIQVLAQPDASDLRLTANLTLNTLVSARFFPWLQEQLARHAGTAARLQFQISELDLLTAQHHMQSFCEQLGEAHIKLCVSHFGSTPDPFRYLSLLHAHCVKLDRSWLEDLCADPRKQEQLYTLTGRLLDSGLRIIAGLVEDMSLLPVLWTARVNFVQGFCLHEPAAVMGHAFIQQRTLDCRSGNHRTN